MKKILALMMVLLMTLSMMPLASADMDSAGAKAAERAAQLSADERVVNVFTWTYYIPDEVVAAFEEASGIRVNYSAMLYNEDIIPKLSAGGAQFDIIVCSDYIIPELASLELIAPLDKAQMPAYENINPAYQGQYFDPDNTYAIPHANSVPALVYDPDAVDFEVKGFADLWKEDFKNNIAVIGEWRGVIGMAQKKLGYSYNDEDPVHIEEVGRELMALKPNIAVMTDDNPHNALISGDAIAGFMYASQVVAAREAVPQLRVVYPEEGLGFGIDCFVMPADAPHEKAGYIFLDYLLDGQVSAMTSELIQYGNCNLKAPEFMSDAYMNNDVVNVPESAVRTAEMMRPLPGETVELYDKIWKEFMQ